MKTTLVTKLIKIIKAVSKLGLNYNNSIAKESYRSIYIPTNKKQL